MVESVWILKSISFSKVRQEDSRFRALMAAQLNAASGDGPVFTSPPPPPPPPPPSNEANLSEEDDAHGDSTSSKPRKATEAIA